MLLAQCFEEFAHGVPFTTPGLLQATADVTQALKRLMVLQEFLISLRALDYNFCLSIHGQDCGVSVLLESGNVIARVSLKVTERVNVGKVYCHCIKYT